MFRDALRMRPTALAGALAYVGCVGGLAMVGFVRDATWMILLAALLTLPVSIVTLPAYYLAYGLMAQIPGANPSQSTGSVACSGGGHCTGRTTGDAAVWFTQGTHVMGILALVAAAMLNVVLLRLLLSTSGRPHRFRRPAATP